MKLNKEELRIVMCDFNSISSRLMRVNYQDYNSILAKFLSYIESEKLIAEYITDCGQPSIDVEAEIKHVIDGHNRYHLELGDDTKAEVTNIYHILKYCLEKEIDISSTLAMPYSWSTKFQDTTDGFNKRVVFVLISHIKDYLNKIGIKMGIDEHTKFSITVNNGQVNVASGNATINAFSSHGIDQDDLKMLINQIRENAQSQIDSEEFNKVSDCLDIIADEVKNQKPNKKVLEMALKGLSILDKFANLATKVASLYIILKPLLE